MKSIPILASIFIILLCASAAIAQETGPTEASVEQIVIEPLFEYPSAPEEMEGLTERSDYLMEHFWDRMDFKNKATVDQNALNDAFGVYTAPMRFATPEVLEASVAALLQKISKNPALTLQFAKAAEENLYGERAFIWNDRVFLKFIDNVLQNKHIKKERKLRYELLGQQLRNTLQGSVPPEFDYKTPDGKISHYHPNGIITVIEFGDPDCDDCRMAKLKMDTNVRFSSLVEKGKINVLFIYVNPEEGWEEKLSGFPEKWHVGTNEEIEDLYDIRAIPSIYVIDREGKVAAKNIVVDTAMEIACEAAEQ